MFSIVIPTFNNLRYLKNCISSIKKNSKFEHEIIAHINEGTDGTENYLISKNIKRAKVFASGKINKAVTLKGIRVSAGARAAIEAAGGKIEE